MSTRLTIRSLFYRLVSDGVVRKDEVKGYAVVRQCTVMRPTVIIALLVAGGRGAWR